MQAYIVQGKRVPASLTQQLQALSRISGITITNPPEEATQLPIQLAVPQQPEPHPYV